MFRRVLICCAAAVLATPVLASAAENIAQAGGPYELTLGGSGSSSKDFHNGGFNLAGGFGYYVTPNFELSARDTVGYTDLGGGSGHSWDNAIRGAVDFNLNFDRFQPFVGVNAGYLDGTGRRGTGEAAPEAGLKFYVTPSSFIYGQMEYDFTFNTSDNNFSNGQFAYIVGIGLRF